MKKLTDYILFAQLVQHTWRRAPCIVLCCTRVSATELKRGFMKHVHADPLLRHVPITHDLIDRVIFANGADISFFVFSTSMMCSVTAFPFFENGVELTQEMRQAIGPTVPMGYEGNGTFPDFRLVREKGSLWPG